MPPRLPDVPPLTRHDIERQRIMKHLFIINPAAGSSDHTMEYSSAIRTACDARRLNYEIRVSMGPGDCARIAQDAAKTGQELRIYACGGDGTLNEIVTGIRDFSNAAVTAYAGGSGNDFVRMFDNPAAFSDLDQLLDAQERRFDLIRVNDDYAFNICSVGLDARIGTDVSSYKRIPFLQGFRAYAVSTVVNVIRGIGEHYVVEINGETIDGEQTMICVCSGQYYGGGFHPVPEADPTDGRLEVLLVKKVSRLQVAGVIGKYKAGKYRRLDNFIRHFTTDSLTIRCDRPNAINLDGELRFAKEIHISVAPEKIRFFYPKTTDLSIKPWPDEAKAESVGLKG